MSSKHTVGLHLRLTENLTTLVTNALEHGLPTFQFFLNQPKDSSYLKITASDLANFLRLKQQFSQPLFLHSSYWINPSTGDKIAFESSRKLLSKEIRLAKKLEIPYLVLHAGSAKKYTEIESDPQNKLQGIATLAKMLNSVLKTETDIQILLENTAHGNKTIGSDLNDFVLLKDQLNSPEKIKFCIDTAHAFAYGYDIGQTEQFVETLDKTMGIDNIKLIHLNDSRENLGTKRDVHGLPGDWKIGADALKKFIKHPPFKDLPKIIECPSSSTHDLERVLSNISNW